MSGFEASDEAQREDPRVGEPEDLGPAGLEAWRELTEGVTTIRPDELMLVHEACRTIDNLATLRDPGRTQTMEKMREERMQQEQLRKLLTAIKWTDDEKSAGEWGRTMANRRWKRRS